MKWEQLKSNKHWWIPTHLRRSLAYGVYKQHKGRYFAYESWVLDGSPKHGPFKTLEAAKLAAEVLYG